MKKKLFVLFMVLCMTLSLGSFSANMVFAEEGPTLEPVKLVMSTSKNETESGGVFLSYFCDRVEELSGGAISFERYYGGTLASATEELSLLENGAIDVASIMGNMFGDTLPLLQFPDLGFESIEKTAGYFCDMLLNNSETADLLAAEAEGINMKYIGYLTAGSKVWFSRSPVTSLADGQGKVFGGTAGLAVMEDLGFNTVPTAPPDCYESLSRGIVDMCGLTLIPACDMMWYEVASNVTFYGAYASGSPLVINLEKWNSLAPEAQAIIQQAADEATQYAIQYNVENEDTYREKLENEWGATIYEFNEEDEATYSEKAIKIGCQDAYNRNNTPEMQTILQAAADYWQVDISDIF